MSSLLNQDPNKLKYSNKALKKDPLPMDYWKTNFDLTQMDKKTEQISSVNKLFLLLLERFNVLQAQNKKQLLVQKSIFRNKKLEGNHFFKLKVIFMNRDL